MARMSLYYQKSSRPPPGALTDLLGEEALISISATLLWKGAKIWVEPADLFNLTLDILGRPVQFFR